MELWFLYAVGAAVFAALTTILAKIGIKNVDSHLATAIRTVVVVVFAWLMVFIADAQNSIGDIQGRTWIFLVLSGLATGGSWLFFFHALKLGNVNKVSPLKKSSTILTMVLAFIFLREAMHWVTVVGMVLIGIGTWLMLELKKKSVDDKEKTNNTWLIFALLAAVFASLVAIFGRIGVADMDANLWTAIRTMVVVPLSLVMVFMVGSQKTIKNIDLKSWVFLILSGIATGASWLFFYHALQLGNAIHVVPIDKLSIVFTMGFARLFLGERFSKQSLIGLGLLVLGTLLPVLLTF
ncbi:MAG: EamA family transporter [Defluviitaleaceae bacterium]|nr:EamA family transporter [Defluviitaleaceae bacterium]